MRWLCVFLLVACGKKDDGPIITTKVTVKEPTVYVEITCRKNRLIEYGGKQINCFFDQPARLEIPFTDLQPGKQTIKPIAKEFKGDARVEVPIEIELPQRSAGVSVVGCSKGTVLDIEPRQKCGFEGGALKLTLSAPPNTKLVVEGTTHDVPATGRIEVAIDFASRFLDQPIEEVNRREMTSTTLPIAWTSPTGGAGRIDANGKPSDIFAAWLRSVLAKPAGFSPTEPRFAALLDENGVSALERTRKVRELAVVAVLEPMGEPKPIGRCPYIDDKTGQKFDTELRGAPAKLTVTNLATGASEMRELPAATACPPFSMSSYKYVLGVHDYPALLEQLAAK